MVLADDSSCSWTASSQDPWIVIYGRSSGTGSQVLRIKVYRNNEYRERTGTVIIAGNTFTVNQGAKPIRKRR
jgi:hypothetical protein